MPKLNKIGIFKVMLLGSICLIVLCPDGYSISDNGNKKQGGPYLSVFFFS